MIPNPFKSKDRLSLITLIVANLVPIVGVIVAGWDAGMIVLLYWGENLIVGFYTILRIAGAKNNPPPNRAPRTFVIPFFCAHYGIFCLVHGGFVVGLVSIGSGGPNALRASGVAGLAALLRDGILPLAALAVSHGVSFVQNYLVRGEYARTTIMREMTRPYARIVVLHLAILFAALPTVLLGSPLPMVMLLVLGKIYVDLWLHGRSHRNLFTGKTESPETPE